MLNQFIRPLTEFEQNELARVLNVRRDITWTSTLKRFLVRLGVCAASVYMTISFWLFFNAHRGLRGTSWSSVLTIVGIAGSVLLGIVALIALLLACTAIEDHFHRTRNAKKFCVEWASKIRAALEDGRASVLRVTTDRVIDIQPFDDEPQAYIYDLGDGTSFFLHGEEYYPDDAANASWPAREFELVRTAVHGWFIGISNARGIPREIRRVSMEAMPGDFAWGDEPATESILKGTPEEILARLGHEPKVSAII